MTGIKEGERFSDIFWRVLIPCVPNQGVHYATLLSSLVAQS